MQPSSAFGLDYAVNAIAMPLIGGTTSWVGPLIGAVLLGSLQQIATVTISSAVNLLIVGLSAGRLRHHRAERHRRAGANTFGTSRRLVGRRSVESESMPRPPPDDGMSALLEVDDLGKRFGGFVALDNISLDRAAGERLGLIGPNGSGKSTLVNCICGTLRNESGSGALRRQADRRHAGAQRTHLGLARSFQLPRPFTSLSLVDNMRIPLLYTVAARGTHRIGRTRSTTRCVELLREVGLEHKARQLPRDLTQVEMRKLELARAMAAEPKLLIADEAMAGLSHSEVEDILALLVR